MRSWSGTAAAARPGGGPGGRDGREGFRRRDREAQDAARRLDHVAGGRGDRRRGEGVREQAVTGRRDHRRRQYALQGRRAPREGDRAAADPLCRCRHLGRRVGSHARLLHDDRRPGRGREAARSDLRHARAGHRRHSTHPEPRGSRYARGARLYPCRAGGRGALRQDGSQRDRIRLDAGLCRRFRHPQGQELDRAAAGAAL